MALSVDDVKKIVDSKIGGMTQMPAPTTFIEGRVVTPQIPTLCTAKSTFDKLAGDAGKALGEMKDAFGKTVDAAKGAFNDMTKEISGAIGDALSGVKQYIVNPIQSACNEALSSLNSAISDLTAKLGTLNSTNDPTGSIRAAITSAIADLNAQLATVNTALSEASKMVGEKFQELMSAMNMCKPEQMPGITQYTPVDFTKTLGQAENLANIKLKASSIQSQVTSLMSNPIPSNFTALTDLRSSMTSVGSTISSAVSSDIANLAGAQAQNEAMGKFMQMAQGLNNPATADFVKQVTNPDLQGLMGRAQVGLANMGAVAGEE